jgi:hypothetical protein
MAPTNSSLTAPGQLSVMDLTGRVLAMATTGVYRQSVFEALGPVASRRHIRDAIAQAKQFGLGTDPRLRDPELGTYYHVTTTQYAAFQAAAKTLDNSQGSTDLATQIITTHQAMRTMLATVAGSTVGLGLLGGWCLLGGQVQAGRVLWLATAVAGGLWGVQRAIARRVL